MKKNNSDGPFFDILREELRHWPYTLHQIDETLDVGLIEGRGKQLLFQSINSRRLTAFVGAGASVAYGRLSWPSWMARVLGDVEEFAKAFDAMATATLAYQKALLNILERPPEKLPRYHFVKEIQKQFSDANEKQRAEQAARNLFDAVRARYSALDLAQREAQKLRLTFDLAKEKSGSFPGGEEAPVKLQFAGQLHDLLHQYSRVFFDHTLYDPEKDPGITNPSYFSLTGRNLQGTPLEGLNHISDAFDRALKDFKASNFDKSNSRSYEIGTKENLSQLYNNIKVAIKDYQENFKKYTRVAKHQSTQLSFLNLNKNLLVDECAHAEQLLLNGLMSPQEVINPGFRDKHRQELRDALQEHLQILDSSNLKRNLDGIKERPERYEVLSAFTFDRLKQFLDIVPQYIDSNDPWKKVLSDLTTEITTYLDLRKNDGRGQRTFLTPTSRFMVEMLPRLVPKPDVENWLRPVDGDGQRMTEGKEHNWEHLRAGLFTPIKSSDYNSRRSVVAERYDVIPKLVTGLNIKRFLTFNYDFELERYFQDSGFETISQNDKFGGGPLGYDEGLSSQAEARTDGVGSIMRDLSFKRETASNLIGFTTEADGADAAVYHLHGRASRDSQIVVTERDYMDLYLQQDSERTIVDESISLAFSANPILFVGVGMNEGDVLRPLRQFISNHDRAAGYNAMVLLPAEDDFAARSKTSAGLFVRYGVHTIFYGSGEVEIEAASQTFCAIDWLHRMQKLNSGLKEVIQRRMKNEKRSPAEWLKFLDKHVDELGANLKNSPFEKETSALAILLGRMDLNFDLETQLDEIELKNCVFTSMRPGTSNIAHEARKRHRAGRLDSSIYTDFYVKLLTGLLRVALGSEENDKTEHGQRQLAAALSALDGLYGSLLTASLNAALAGISEDHKLWWQDWQQSPPHRVAQFEVLPNLPPVAPRKLNINERERRKAIVLPRRFIRHRIINSITELSIAEDSTAATMKVPGPRARLKGPSIRKSVADTGVRSLTTFFEAIVATRIKIAKAKGTEIEDASAVQGRIIHTVAARRGLGKGSFMAALSTRLGLTGYIEAQWSTTEKSKKTDEKIIFLGAVFVNLSFSTEIASVYDMVTSALLDACAMKIVTDNQCIPENSSSELEKFYAALNTCLGASRGKGPPKDKFETYDEPEISLAHDIYDRFMEARKVVEYDVREMPRIAKLRELLGLLSKPVPQKKEKVYVHCSCRFFICISGADLLFTHDRNAKNSEIQDILEFLLGPNSEKFLIDLIVIGSVDGMGTPWLTSAGPNEGKECGNVVDLSLKHIRNDRLGLSKEAEESIQLLEDTSGVKFEQWPEPLSDGTQKPEARVSKIQHFGRVHFMRAVKPTDLLVDNFRPLVASLHLLAYHDRLNRGEYEVKISCDPELLRKKMASIEQRDLVFDLNAEIQGHWNEGKTPLPWAEYADTRSKFLNRLIGRIYEKIENDIAKYPKISSNTNTNTNTNSKIENSHEELEKIGSSFILPKNSEIARRKLFLKMAAKRYSVDLETDADEWKLIRKTFGSNRFSLTILLAAAQDLSLRKKM